MPLRPVTARLLLVAFLATSTLAAGQDSPPPKPWTGTAEASASLLQGNTDQRAIFTRTELGRADSTVQFRGSISFGYAEAARDTLPRSLTRRTWLGALSMDLRPFDRLSPFLFVNYEASFEKRILDRVGVGVGGKAVLVQSPGSDASISLAMLAERLRPSRLAPDSDPTATARWSSRARLRHQFDPRLRFAHTTFWQPEVRNLESFTVNSTSELSFAVRQSTSLTVSYQTLYDSAARGRGARSNNDAQVLFGIKTTF